MRRTIVILLASVALAAATGAVVHAREAVAQPRTGSGATFRYHDAKAGPQSVTIAQVSVIHNPLANAWFIEVVGPGGPAAPTCEIVAPDEAQASSFANLLIDNLGRGEVVDCSFGPAGIHPSIPHDRQKVISLTVNAP